MRQEGRLFFGWNIKRNNSEIKIFNETCRKIDNPISYAILEIEED